MRWATRNREDGGRIVQEAGRWIVVEGRRWRAMIEEEYRKWGRTVGDEEGLKRVDENRRQQSGEDNPG